MVSSPLAQWERTRAGAPAALAGQVQTPECQRDLLVADSGNNRVERFNLSGGEPLAWGTRGAEPGEFSYPRGVAANEAEVIVSDDDNLPNASHTGYTFLLPYLEQGNVQRLYQFDRRDVLRMVPFIVIGLAMIGVEVWFGHVEGIENVRSDGFLNRAAIAGCAVEGGGVLRNGFQDRKSVV